MNAAGLAAIVIASVLIYFLPTIIAMRRRHANRWLILVLNTLFGATGLGWLGTLIWSLHAVHRADTGWRGGESGLNFVGNDAAHLPSANPAAVLSSADATELRRLKTLLDQQAISEAEYRSLRHPIVDRLGLSEVADRAP